MRARPPTVVVLRREPQQPLDQIDWLGTSEGFAVAENGFEFVRPHPTIDVNYALALLSQIM